MQLRENQKVQEFFTQILEGVRLKEAHEEIRQEYLSHLEESVENKMQPSLNQEQAIQQALKEMGPTQKINQELQRIHRPSFDLLLAIPPLLLSVLGVFSLSQLGLAGLQGLWILLGLGAATALYFTKPSKIIGFSAKLYAITAGLLALAHLFGPSYEGQVYLPLGFATVAMVDLSLLLFFIAINGLLSRELESAKSERALLLLSLAPLLYFSLVEAFASTLLYFTGVMTLLIAAKSKNWMTLTFAGFGFVSLWLQDTSSFLAKAELTTSLSTWAHTDFAFYHLQEISPGLATLSLVLLGLFVIRSFMASKEIKNRFGSTLIAGFSVMFSIATIWGLGANTGTLPIPKTGLNIPFLSYGGTLIVCNFAFVGLILGALRRKSLTLV